MRKRVFNSLYLTRQQTTLKIEIPEKGKFLLTFKETLKEKKPNWEAKPG